MEWIVLGGSSPRIPREYLIHTTAQAEGMTEDATRQQRRRRKPSAEGPPLFTKKEKKKKPPKVAAVPSSSTTTPATTNNNNNKGKKRPATTAKKNGPVTIDTEHVNVTTSSTSSKKVKTGTDSVVDEKKTTTTTTPKAGKKRKLGETAKVSNTTDAASVVAMPLTPKRTAAAMNRRDDAADERVLQQSPTTPIPTQSSLATLETSRSMSLYEKHRREFERIVCRLEKIDRFVWFWDDAPPELEEVYELEKEDDDEEEEEEDNKGNKKSTRDKDTRKKPPPPVYRTTFPTHAPFNWEMIRRRLKHGRYVLNREVQEEEERFQALGPYYEWRGKWPKRKFVASQVMPTTTHCTGGGGTLDGNSSKNNKKKPRVNRRVLHRQGVNWDLFCQDALHMLDTTIERVEREAKRASEDEEEEEMKNHEMDEDRCGTGASAAATPNNINNSNEPQNLSAVAKAAQKVREKILLAVEKTGRRHDRELRASDDRHKFALAIDKSANHEAAMQLDWRTQPFPERIYERLSSDSVCAGLSRVDERIASHELLTSLDDSFMGVSYRYDDTGQQSEAWMKSVLDETEFISSSSASSNKKSRNNNNNNNNGGCTTNNSNASKKKKRLDEQTALAVAGAEGVTRAQATATMNTLLMGVEDRVMTDKGVLLQPELRSANWFQNNDDDKNKTNKDDTSLDKDTRDDDDNNNMNNIKAEVTVSANAVESGRVENPSPGEEKSDAKVEGGQSIAPKNTKPTTVGEKASNLEPELVEQPVWGIDCYTRRNISICLESEFDAETALKFIEKWLLPAINACPPDLAHDLSNAARLLEGLPFEQSMATDDDGNAIVAPAVDDDMKAKSSSAPPKAWSHTLLGNALVKKINTAAPPWITAVANTLRRAILALGSDFFRVHPKGHGSVLLSEKVEANSLITFYRGEIYPLWRWCEKMDAIDMTQQRKNLKPALPDFYNITMERPQTDPRGYGTLIVDASRKAGHGSSLSHSCDPTCEVRVAALNGELCLAMTTLRELEIGEELTFNYNASTDSVQEYRSAVCLCGYGNCRGSFLHFATADWYQQVLNRNCPIATRVANLVKGSTKQVMSEDDDRILRNHGFKTAAFGATAVNRRELRATKRGTFSLSDSLDIVPVWLKTYVAEVLRYIEYERRALPIALIKNGEGGGVKGGDGKSDDVIQPENGFSFFVKNQVDILVDLVKRNAGTDLSEENITNETRRLGANLWRSLSAEKKQRWQDAAMADMEKRKKELADKNTNKKSTGGNKRSKKDSNCTKNESVNKADIASLISSEFEFEDADAEGISAMGQRVQQLTATLSRVGRVLDRHREGLIVITQQIDTNDTEALCGAIHPPLSVMADEDVVDWIWNSSDGVIVPFLRKVESARCVRPSLIQGIMSIRQRYSARLEQHLGDCNSMESSDGCGTGARQVLNEGLLELRSLILMELRAMAKDFRHRKKPPTSSRAEGTVDEEKESGDDKTMDEGPNTKEEEESAGEGPPSMTGEEEKELLDEKTATRGRTEVSDASKEVEEDEVTATDTLLAGVAAQGEVNSVLRCLLDAVEERVRKEGGNEDLADKLSAPQKSAVTETDRKESTATKTSRFFAGGVHEEKEEGPWITHYSDRFMLQASADVILMYAHTHNFFSISPYASLESSPIEIYARELGNNVPRSVIDNEVTYADDANETTTSPPRKTALTSPVTEEEVSKPRKVSRKKSEEKCSPEDVVAEVNVSYHGDYILSQLLQWYNGGMGQKSGLPNLAGTVVLPSVETCWASKLSAKRRSKVLTKTFYESKLRPKLVEWMQDPYRRGDPWPDDVDEAFAPNNCKAPLCGDMECGVRFGTPVLDFLVTGDESGIFNVLEELDADNKVSSACDDPSLLTSVDKGRPAQAVCRWVQCENPDCLKWRKIPWHVDIDLLPEHFFCKDNEWNPSKRSCNAPEDDWDNEDKIVSADGKVEGSPMMKDKFTSPSNENSFFVGARFDVLRVVNREEKYSVATVTHVDFSGSIKRVKFHFKQTSSDADEWIPFGSRRIAPFHSKTTTPVAKRKLVDGEKGAKRVPSSGARKASSDGEKKVAKKAVTSGPKKATQDGEKLGNKVSTNCPKKDPGSEAEEKQAQEAAKRSDSAKSGTGLSNVENGSRDASRRKKQKFTCPKDVRSFVRGARFDVLRMRKEKEKWVVATVVNVEDISEGGKRVRFHFRKSKDEDDVWIRFGSSRIAELHTHTSPYQKKRKSTDDNGGQSAKVTVPEPKKCKAEECVVLAPSIAEPSAVLGMKNVAEVKKNKAEDEKKQGVEMCAGGSVEVNELRQVEKIKEEREQAQSASACLGSEPRTLSGEDEVRRSENSSIENAAAAAAVALHSLITTRDVDHEDLNRKASEREVSNTPLEQSQQHNAPTLSGSICPPGQVASGAVSNTLLEQSQEQRTAPLSASNRSTDGVARVTVPNTPLEQSRQKSAATLTGSIRSSDLHASGTVSNSPMTQSQQPGTSTLSESVVSSGLVTSGAVGSLDPHSGDVGGSQTLVGGFNAQQELNMKYRGLTAQDQFNTNSSTASSSVQERLMMGHLMMLASSSQDAQSAAMASMQQVQGNQHPSPQELAYFQLAQQQTRRQDHPLPCDIRLVANRGQGSPDFRQVQNNPSAYDVEAVMGASSGMNNSNPTAGAMGGVNGLTREQVLQSLAGLTGGNNGSGVARVVPLSSSSHPNHPRYQQKF